jgi:hypothetical protein
MMRAGPMQTLPFDEIEQRKAYEKCTKEELINFLIARDKNREYCKQFPAIPVFPYLPQFKNTQGPL